MAVDDVYFLRGKCVYTCVTHLSNIAVVITSIIVIFVLRDVGEFRFRTSGIRGAGTFTYQHIIHIRCGLDNKSMNRFLLLQLSRKIIF